MMKIHPNRIAAFIPARGGSKSVPVKNLALLHGWPMISYCIAAGLQSSVIDDIYCSTDHVGIAEYVQRFGVTVLQRPEALTGDMVPTVDVLWQMLESLDADCGVVPEYVVLLEATSPFIAPEDISALVELLKSDPKADSAQTITQPPPNHNAYNQREFIDGLVTFRFAKEREDTFNKQTRPVFYVHGNCRVFRTESFLRHRCIYGDRSLGHPVPPFRAIDVDGPNDFIYAEALISAGVLTPCPAEEVR